MNWNYRVVKDGDTHHLAEVYFRNGKPWGWAVVEISANSLEQLKKDCGQIGEAFNFLVVESGDIGLSTPNMCYTKHMNPLKKVLKMKGQAERRLQGLGQRIGKSLRVARRTPEQRYQRAMRAYHEQAEGRMPKRKDYGLPPK